MGGQRRRWWGIEGVGFCDWVLHGYFIIILDFLLLVFAYFFFSIIIFFAMLSIPSSFFIRRSHLVFVREGVASCLVVYL
jgi:hypothetical protein